METRDTAVFHTMHFGERDALCVVPSTWWKSAECFSDHGISHLCDVSGKSTWFYVVSFASDCVFVPSTGGHRCKEIGDGFQVLWKSR